MAIVEIHPEPIKGPWAEGYVLDKHMISSVPVGHDGARVIFDNTRTALGELVYQFKNRGGSPDDVIDTASEFALRQWKGRVDCVVSPPPSVLRRIQPAAVLAAALAHRLHAAHVPKALVKVQLTPQMKNLPTDERAGTLEQAIQPGEDRLKLKGGRVLIVDDLWQTGSTMRRVASVVTSMGASEIHALAMTRTK